MTEDEKYLHRIADYLDGKMDEAAEVAFMHELSDNTELRQLFEEELKLSNLLQTTAVGDFSANEHFSSLPPTILARPTLWRRHLSQAAAVVGLIGVGAAALLWYKKSVVTPPAVVAHHVPMPSSGAVIKPKAADTSNQRSLTGVFEKFYKTYTAQSDPVQVSNYYKAYRNAQYKFVLDATEADYLLMSADASQDYARRFMDLYKGLSYLALNQENKAIRLFDDVLNASNYGLHEHQAALWYKGLALVKLGKFEAAGKSFSVLRAGSGVYSSQAKAILPLLEKKQ